MKTEQVNKIDDVRLRDSPVVRFKTVNRFIVLIRLYLNRMRHFITFLNPS